MKKTNYFPTLIFLLFANFSNSFAQQNDIKEIKKIDKIIENEEDFNDEFGAEEIKPEIADLSRFNNVAVVQALNKTTAKTSILDLKIGEKISFGSLKILAHKCWQSPLEQKPENKILLEIFEFKNESETKLSEKRIFYGWMFSSSPSISGLEHPIYDIIALNCKNK
jgi:hypothetical protein